jgi:uncharacterized protein YdaU (DUF1376 family)
MSGHLFVQYCAKDFLDGCNTLDPWEELAYRRIVDLIYATGNRLIDDDRKLAWQTKVGSRWRAIKAALIASGKIVMRDGLITNARCDVEIEKIQRKIAQTSRAGLASADKRRPTAKVVKLFANGSTDVRSTVGTEGATECQPTTELLNQVSDLPKRKSSSRGATGARITADWEPDDERLVFARSLDLDPAKVRDEFRDYWIGIPGQKGLKADWQATFQNRCRQLAERGVRHGKDGQRTGDLFASRQERGTQAADRASGALARAVLARRLESE